jgi:predicted DNA-binding transcriptional regulator AlpA
MTTALAIPAKRAADLFGLKECTFLRLVDKGVFPQPVMLSEKTKRWDFKTLEMAWQKLCGRPSTQDPFSEEAILYNIEQKLKAHG